MRERELGIIVELTDEETQRRARRRTQVSENTGTAASRAAARLPQDP